MKRRVLVSCVLPLVLSACGSGGSATPVAALEAEVDAAPGASPADAADSGAVDATVPDAVAADVRDTTSSQDTILDSTDPAPDTATDVLDVTYTTDTTDTTADFGPPPPPLSDRGLVAARAALHVHSAFSHDACDGAGFSPEGAINAPCVASLRAGMCATGFDFMLLTDHPGHMSEHPFEELLHFHPELGDTLVKAQDGTPIANLVPCPDGDGTRTLVLRVGFEGTHTMPVALEGHLDPLALEKVSLADDTSAAERAAVVDAVHAAGGAVVIAHSEEDELSAQTIIDLPIEAMEVYNFHANFTTILSEAPERLIELEPFLDGSPGPEPNLLGLVMLDVFPEPGIDKWRTVLASRPITGVVGHDVHENVNLTGYCDPGGRYVGLCGMLEAAFPHLVATLKKGGPVILEDGDRLDSYRRIFGWMHNRMLVTAVEPGAERDALQTGRNIVIWNVFGEPHGLDVVAMAGGTPVEVGGAVSLSDDPVIWVRLPTTAAPGPENHWGTKKLEEGVLEATLWRIVSGAPPEPAWTSQEWGAVVPFMPTLPGAYQLELKIVPLHLAAALEPVPEIASRTFRWVEASPIYVGP